MRRRLDLHAARLRVIAMLGLLLAACADGPDPSGPSAARRDQSGDAVARLAEARRSNATTIPIELNDDRVFAEQGMELEVDVVITALRDSSDLALEIGAGPGLEIAAGGGRVEIGDIADGDSVSTSVVVLGMEPGIAYLYVYVSGDFESVASGGSYAIPIHVGGELGGQAASVSGVAAAPAIALDHEGQPLIAHVGEER